MNKIQTIGSVLAAGAVLAMPLFALADDGPVVSTGVSANVSVTNSGSAGATTNASASTGILSAGLEARDRMGSTTRMGGGPGNGVNAAARAARVASSTENRMGKMNTRGSAEIDARITALTTLSGKIGDMARLTADEKTSLSTSITNEIATLTSLKAKLDTDTSTTSLKADVQSITDANRVYVLVIPQEAISAASDRILAAVNLMQTLGTKIQVRISAATAAGANVTAAQTAYTDMNAKLTDATSQAQAAATETVALKADNGDKTVYASNETTLKDARTKLQAAQADLKAARADLTTILGSIKGKGEASATASTTASS